MKRKLIKFNLQLFGDEGDVGGTVDAGASVDSSIDTSGDVTETSDQIATEESFDDLINGRFKDEYNKRMQTAIKKRIKDTKQLEARVNSFAPIFEAYGSRYGIDPKDEQSIINKLMDENSLYEDEAIQRGMDVDTLKTLKATERENAMLRRQQAEAQQNMENERKFQNFQAQAQALKQLFPSFDLDTEMQNREFERLTWEAGVPLETAYKLLHQDEILASGMQYAVQQTRQKISNDIRSNGMRPSEGGTSRQAATSLGNRTPKDWTKEERAQFRERVKNGERIVL